jgi:hypothetical protein
MNFSARSLPWMMLAVFAAAWFAFIVSTMALPSNPEMPLGHGHGRPCRSCH